MTEILYDILKTEPEWMIELNFVEYKLRILMDNIRLSEDHRTIMADNVTLSEVRSFTVCDTSGKMIIKLDHGINLERF